MLLEELELLLGLALALEQFADGPQAIGPVAKLEKDSAWRGDLRRIVKGGVLGRTCQFVTDTWFGRTSTTVTFGEEHRCSRTWKNGLRFVGMC